jgi:hypothetical protein
VVLRKQLRRGQVLAFFSAPPFSGARKNRLFLTLDDSVARVATQPVANPGSIRALKNSVRIAEQALADALLLCSEGARVARDEDRNGDGDQALRKHGDVSL